jgi:hypothetical protein
MSTAFREHTWHLGSLATQQDALRFAARRGHTFDDATNNFRIEALRSDGVQEEEGHRTLNQHIVDAMVDDVATSAFPQVHGSAELGLGANAVGACDQERVIDSRK